VGEAQKQNKKKKLGGGWGKNKVPQKIEIRGNFSGKGRGENKVAKKNCEKGSLKKDKKKGST